MCSGSKREVTSVTGVSMEGTNSPLKQDEGFCGNSSVLLELSAVNDLASFKRAVEEEGHDVDESSSWYGRRIGSKKMGFEERTPLMIAAMFGSKDVLSYILQTGCVGVNRASGSDGATALHCAAAGGSYGSHEIAKLLVDASADINCVSSDGSRPCDVIALGWSTSKSRKILESMLAGKVVDQEPVLLVTELSNKSNGTEKKEYPIDPSFPDIKNGVYSTDKFRMFTFKVKPCSRAYSHDWTECPFVHPGENARRRDPRKYHYSCVPCPEFRKGSCSKGDACEYAHGIFECWLHPAQYRTRLCKDETNCARRVCFFAHKPEEIRPLYASTGSAIPSPRSMSPIGASSFDMALLSPLALGPSSVLLPSTSTPPMTPTSVQSSPMGFTGAMWHDQLNVATPPALQLPGSRLRAALNARNLGLEAELRGIENQRRMQQFEELAGLSSPSRWSTSLMSNGEPPAVMSQSPTGMQIRQNANQQLRSTYPLGITSSPVKALSLLNSRTAAFANRSQSFIDRGAMNRLSGLSSPTPTMMPSQLSQWGSPDGRLDWGIQGEELNKLRKSASFGFHSTGNANVASGTTFMEGSVAGPDVSRVQSILKDEPAANSEQLYHLSSGGSEMIPSWAEQLYSEQEQVVG